VRRFRSRLLCQGRPIGRDALPAFADQGHRAVVIGTTELGAGVIDADGDAILWPERDEVARSPEQRGTPSSLGPGFSRNVDWQQLISRAFDEGAAGGIPPKRR
jgi:hypothetical protein